jgi:hypothetical protein
VADITLDQLMAGIKQEESGGNYSVTNSIGALGAYQVMTSNVASWSRQVLGYSISPQTFLSSPSLQDQIVRGILGGYFNRYGAAGAAAMWFSGQPNPNSGASDGNTTVRNYVNNVLSYAGGSNASSGGGNMTSTSGQTTASIDPSELAVQYGFTKAFLDANPDLKNIFNQAVAHTWSADRFTAALQNTTWFKTHSSDERTWLLLLSTDPKSAGQQWNQAQTHLKQLLSAQGSYYPIDNKTYNMLLYNMVAKKWTDQQVQYVGGQYVKLVNGKMTGDAETQYANGLQYAYSMGVTMSNSWYQQQVQNIERGIGTFADLQAGIRNQAKAQYSQFAKQIDGGQTVQDLASPYIQQMANILEVNGSALNAFDPTIKKALTYKDPTTGQSGAQPLWQFENTLRQDPRWLQTNNARDSMMTVAHGVLQQFGMSI